MIGKEVGRLVVYLGADINSYRKKMKLAEVETRKRTGAIGQAHTKLGSMVTLGYIAAATAMVAFGVSSVKASTKLNEGMADVATLIPGNIERVKELKAEVQDLAKETGKSSDDIVKGLYQTISAFQDTADSVAILRIGAQMAIAGVASTADALNLLIPATKGYGDTTKEAAAHAADLAFETVRLGVTTLPQLAQSFGRVAPLASALKVKQEELFASYAALTGATGDTAQASTQLIGIMRAMMKPTDATKQAIKNLGYESSQTMIDELGLVNALRLLIGTTDGSAESIGTLFENARALPAVFHLSGTGADDFYKKLEALQTSTGAMGDALKEQTEGINRYGHAWSKAGQEVETAKQSLGDFLSMLAAALTQTGARTGGAGGVTYGLVPPMDYGPAAGEMAAGSLSQAWGPPGGKPPGTSWADAQKIAAERAAEAWAKLKKEMRETVAGTDTIKFTSGIEQGIINKELSAYSGQVKELHTSLTSINTDYEEMNGLVIVSAENLQEWADQAAQASHAVAEGIYSIFDALEADDFWASMWQSTKRYFQMLIAESIRSRSYAWFLSAFSGGNATTSGGGVISGIGNKGLGNQQSSAPIVNLINNSGMPLEASASMGSGGSLDVILAGPITKLFNSGKMDGTMKQFNAYRTVGA